LNLQKKQIKLKRSNQSVSTKDIMNTTEIQCKTRNT